MEDTDTEHATDSISESSIGTLSSLLPFTLWVVAGKGFSIDGQEEGNEWPELSWERGC